MDYSKFDNKIDIDQLKRDTEEIKKNGGTGDYPEIGPGIYHGKFEKLEAGSTKDGRPMLKAMFRITKGNHKKQCLFYNRTIYGTRNDANMIASALGWLETLDPSEDVGPITFEGYGRFADLIMDIAEDIADLEYDVEYDPDAWNTISIEEVYE